MSRPAVVAGGAALVVAALVGGWVDQRRFADQRYIDLDPAFDAANAAPEGTRIGLAGLWDPHGVYPILPMFGPRLRHEVSYVGPVRREMLQQYRNPAAFRAALREGGYDLLLIGLGDPKRPTVAEERWARAAGFQPIARSDRLALYRAS